MALLISSHPYSASCFVAPHHSLPLTISAKAKKNVGTVRPQAIVDGGKAVV